MSSQTVYFTNPAVITGIQSQVGTIPNQVTTSQINLTGALYSSANQFVDKWTFPKGLGSYQIDCIPLAVKDTFAMPKFSQYTTNQSGGSLAIVTGANYTVQTFDTEVGYDMVVFAPSARATMQTSPMFPQTTPGQLDFAGTWGPLEDYRGPFNNGATPGNTTQSLYGSTGLGTAWTNFWNICSSGTTSTGARQTALDAVTSHPDYVTIKANMKYPFKVFNHVKGATEFQFDNLLDLNGAPLVNTGANGVTGYNTQITATTYGATGNLLPVAQNVNATGGKMGLFLNFLGNGMTPNVCVYGYQAASLGYICVNLPSHPLSQYYSRYGGGFKTTSQLMADKVITIPTTGVPGIYMDTANMYSSPIDSTYPNNGFYRTAVFSSHGTDPAKLFTERYFYQIKCALHKLGLSTFIDYNNVVVAGYSAGGLGLSHSHILLSNSPAGSASQFTIQGGSKPMLWNIKAFIGLNANFWDYTQKIDASLSQYSVTNNRLLLKALIPLKVPMITVTDDVDVGFTGRTWDAPYNCTAQTIYQCTKQYPDYNIDRYIMGRSAVFYKPASYHSGVSDGSVLRTNGSADEGLYFNGFYSDFLQGWYLPLNPTFPALDNIYESGLQLETIYQQVIDMKMIALLTLLPHRWLGANFPFPVVAFPNFGLRYDVGPTHCDVLTDHEYMRVGPWAQLTYDSNYNLILNNVPGATGSTQPPVSLYATGAGQTIGATALLTTTFTGTNAAISTLNVTQNLKVTNTIASGTGAITANTPAGQVIFGSQDASLVITNSLVSTNSIIIATVATNDATLKSIVAEAGSGSFTLTPNTQSTNDTKVNWMILN